MLENSEKYGIDVNIQDCFKNTPFQELCYHESHRRTKETSIVQALEIWVNYPFDVDIGSIEMLRKVTLQRFAKNHYENLKQLHKSTFKKPSEGGQNWVKKGNKRLITSNEDNFSQLEKETLVQIVFEIFDKKQKEMKLNKVNE